MDLEVLAGTKASDADVAEVKSKFNPSDTSNVNIVPYHIYDETERVVGEWFGKTLYEKTIQLTTPSVSDTEVSTGLTGIRFCFIQSARIHFSNGYNGNVTYMNGDANSMSILLKDDGTKVFFVLRSDLTKSQTCYLTVRYTKS